MSHEITLKPSGHTYESPPSETLLEAGLSHGINLKYNCSSGTCGNCKARRISGKFEQIDFHDYVLSESEKLHGYFLMCRAHAGSDMVIEAGEVHSTAEVPRQSISAKVAKIDALNDDYRVLHVRTPRTQTLRFLAGQSVRLTLDNGMSKILPIASCPCNGLLLQFHLRRKQEDGFCRQVFESVSVGQRIRLDGPCGNVTLNEKDDGPLLFIAVDTGFAPVKSLIEHAINLDYREQISLFWLSSRENGHYLSNYCRSWEGVLDDFVYVPIRADITAEEPELTTLLATSIADMLPNLAVYSLYVAAVPEVAAVIEATLFDKGLVRGKSYRVEFPGKVEGSTTTK